MVFPVLLRWFSHMMDHMSRAGLIQTLSESYSFTWKSQFIFYLPLKTRACWCFYSLDAIAQRKAPPVQSGVCAVMWLAGCCWRSVLHWYSVPVFLNLRWFSHMDLIVFFFWLWVFSRSAESVTCCSFTSLCLLSGNSLELSGRSLFTV